MDDLSAFIASAIEFIVGGIMFGLALGLSLLGRHSPHLTNGVATDLGANGAVVGVVLVALAYAVGVVAESLARGVFEFMLDRLTVRKAEFLPEPATIETPSERRNALQRARRRVIVWSLGHRPAEGDSPRVSYTVEDRDSARDRRETQRTAVMGVPALNTEVQGQLKRLRMERVFALSLALTTEALIVRHQPGYAVIAAASTLWMVWSIHTRFGRFCGAIARSYKKIQVDSGRQAPGAASGESAVS